LSTGLRLLLIGDDPLARSALAALLAEDGELLLVGQATSAEAAPLPALDPDVTLWDMGLPREKDDAARRGGFDGPLVALVAAPAQVAEARAAGARGILRRDTDAPRLLAALRAVAAGLVVLDDASSSALRPLPREPRGAAEALTPREQEVLQLMASGLSNKEIARRLAISEHTAKFHVAKLLQKLGAESRSEAVFVAARLGLLLV
jgi:two-component system, NarL family, nitrate/nitrite response regulator NarL